MKDGEMLEFVFNGVGRVGDQACDYESDLGRRSIRSLFAVRLSIGAYIVL